MAVGDADGADVVALGEEELEDHQAVLVQALAVVLTSMPSATLVVQAGRSLSMPATSTMQSRQAPMSQRPSRWQRVGIVIPASVAAWRIVAFRPR